MCNKIKIILLLLIPYLSFGQDYSILVVDSAVVINDPNLPQMIPLDLNKGKIVVVDNWQSWVNDMKASYRTLNSHYRSGYWTDTISPILDTVLSPYFSEFDANGNLIDGYYYYTFGPPGQDKSVCDFILVMLHDGNTGILSSIKSGDVMRWSVGGDVSYSNNSPAHTFNNNWRYIISSTDGWGGVTTFQLYSNNLIGQFPYVELGLTGTFDISDNDFNGTMPGIGDNTPTSYVIAKDFTGINDFDWISTSIGIINLHNNDFTVPGVDAVIQAIHDYFVTGEVTPIKNLSIYLTGTTMPTPSATGLSNITLIENWFASQSVYDAFFYYNP